MVSIKATRLLQTIEAVFLARMDTKMDTRNSEPHYFSRSLASYSRRTVQSQALETHARYYPAAAGGASHLTRRVFGGVLRRIATLPSPAGASRRPKRISVLSETGEGSRRSRRMLAKREPPPFSLRHLLQRVKIFDDVASRKHSDKAASQHDRHLINSVPAHLCQCCP